MTNIERIIFDVKYKVELHEYKDNTFIITYKCSSYIHSSIVVEQSGFEVVAEAIIYLSPSEFHDFVKDFVNGD